MSRRHWRQVAVVGLVLALVGCGQEDRPQPALGGKEPPALADESWPNVLLISVDSLRPDHLGCYGYQRPTSPRIDRLAGEGALFVNAISSTSWTLPAHCALFTGLADSVHGCVDTDRRLHEDHYTLAERLRDAGYATVGFFSGPSLHPVFGVGQGFESYVDCTSYAHLSDQRAAESHTTESPEIWTEMCRDVTSPRICEKVSAWLRGNERRPFLMFVHLWDVHYDYIPPPPYDTMFDPEYTGRITGENFLFNPQVNKDMPAADLQHLIALYDGEIRWTDEHVGKILDEFRALELLDETIVILLSDHGTAFFEHDLKGHRNTLYDELIRIPLIMRYPRRIPAGQRFSEQVRMIDMLPTILDMLGIPPKKEAPLMGQSLAPLFVGGRLARYPEPAISELNTWGHQLEAYRVPERKTIFYLDRDAGVVYDLVSDPGELAPVTNRDSPIVKAAIADGHFCRRFLETFRKLYPQSPVVSELPRQLLEQLRQMGYVEPEQPTGSRPAAPDRP